MQNRSYSRARNGKLRGQQLDITFPRRGRPTKHRVLERCGQLQLELQPARICSKSTDLCNKPPTACDESLDDALQMCFPIGPLSEIELEAEFNRLFPPD
jgi:hypothetical protein